MRVLVWQNGSGLPLLLIEFVQDGYFCVPLVSSTTASLQWLFDFCFSFSSPCPLQGGGGVLDPL